MSEVRTIGLLGGMSWESSIEYERIINTEVRRILGGVHSASASSLSQIVRLPRLLRPRSYSLQFRILYVVLYLRLTRLDFPAAVTSPPRSP